MASSPTGRAPVDLKAAADLEADGRAQGAEKEGEADPPPKLPKLTVTYWAAKILATTLGEVFADLFSQTLKLGYYGPSCIFLGVFVAGVKVQVVTTRYVPPVYWLVIIASSIAGTSLSDMLNQSFFCKEKTLYALGYAKGAGMLFCTLCGIFSVWACSGYSLSVTGPMGRPAELFYWSCILVSNTLGTALGDFASHNLHLGFAGGACLFGGLMLLTALLALLTPLSRIGLFWTWFVLTRPFGATFGDMLTKTAASGGLGLGTGAASVMFGIPLLAVVILITYDARFPIQLRCFRRLETLGDKPLFRDGACETPAPSQQSVASKSEM